MAQCCMTQRNATEKTQKEWKRHPGVPGALLTAVPLADPAPLAPSLWSQGQSLFLFSSAVNGVGGQQQPADTAALFTGSGCGLH